VPLAGATHPPTTKDGSANKSVFCEGIKALLVRMTRHAMSNGIKFEQIEEVLVR
jgi:hypothetical protein